MATLATRVTEELTDVLGYSVDLENKIQSLKGGECPLVGAFALMYEQCVFEIAKISEDYKGGQWGVDQGLWILVDNKDFTVGNPNAMRNETLNSKSFSFFCSIAALNKLSWHFHNKGHAHLANLAIYAYHRAFTQMEFEDDIQVDVIRSLLD